MADRVLLITGASSGMGRATAEAAAAAGWRVAAAARREDEVLALAEQLGGPERAIGIRCDISEWDEQQAMVARTLEAFGRIDGVFANAGAFAEPGWKADPVEVWKQNALVNVYGTALTARATLDALMETKGRILLTSSRAARFMVKGSFYACTKAAVTAMGEALRLELNDTGVGVTVIEPGWVRTPMSIPGLPDEIVEAEDIASAVLYVLDQPSRVDISQMLIRATSQPV
jgi:NADP-dependent 3-hydroxy acid dehydrogenase YdfG